jgi:pimeloyl-ACP methyl ester carboxylesterase
LKSRFAKFGDVKIHYQNRGKGDQALVFVHGWTSNSDFWRSQLNDFARFT